MKTKITKLIIALPFLLACSPSEVQEDKNHPLVEVDSVATVSIELDETDPALFSKYYEICEKNLKYGEGGVDALDLMKSAFSEMYNRPEPEGAIDWDFLKCLYLADDLLAMQIDSWFEGVSISYLVVIDKEGYIQQFDFIGASNDVIIEMNSVDNSGLIQITKRTGYTIADGEIYDVMSIENEYYKRADKLFVISNEVVLKPENTTSINLEGEDDVLKLDLAYIYSNDYGPSQCNIDIYKDAEFFTRLEQHPANNWSIDGENSINVADYNSDGLEDVLITLPAVTGMGPEGMIPFPVHSIYFQNDFKGFVQLNEIDEQLKNELQSTEELKAICKGVELD